MFWAKEEEEDNSLILLLKTGKCTLKDVLLDENVVQESRYGKPALVSFITRQENLIEMLKLSLNPFIDDSIPLKQQYRLSFIASEIITGRGTDVYQDAIVTCEETKNILINFINDTTPLNHLVAGFFAKILECLLSKTFDATYEILQSSNFFEKCLSNINLGAMECLLENLVRIPSSLKNIFKIKQLMIRDRLFDKIIERIDENSTDDDNDCLSDVYCEIIRELRDKLYIFDDKNDPLHNEIMNDDRISAIANKLIIKETTNFKEISNKTSVIRSAAQILETLIKTNFVFNSPSHLIEKVEREEMDERHRSYSTSSVSDYVPDYEEQNYQPDAERITEGILANRLLNVLQTTVTDIENNGVVWQYLLRLLIEISNTNYMPTHEKILKAFQQLPFIKLIRAAQKLPTASILHTLIVKFINFLFYSKFHFDNSTMSPVIEFILKDSGLIDLIHETAFTFQHSEDLISACGLRTFNMNLANVIFKAKYYSPSAKQIETIVLNNSKWLELEEAVKDYNEQHRPINNLETTTFHDPNITIQHPFDVDDKDFLNNSEEWSDATSKLAEIDLKNDVLKRSDESEKNDEHFNFNMSRFSDLESNQFDDTPDEDEFKKLCSQRANSVNDTVSEESSGSLTNPVATVTTSANFDWPGMSGGEVLEEDVTSQQDEQEWVWPTKPPVGETEVVTKAGPRPESTWVAEAVKEMKDDQFFSNSPDVAETHEAWADFSSFPESSKESEVKWPGAEKQKEGESSEWPHVTNSEDLKSTDPVTIGIASGISHPINNGSSDA